MQIGMNKKMLNQYVCVVMNEWIFVYFGKET